MDGMPEDQIAAPQPTSRPDLPRASLRARRGRRPFAVAGLAAGHAVATFVGCVLILGSTVTACANADVSTSRHLMIAGFCGLAIIGLVAWGIAAVHWRRSWLLMAGAVAAAPALWWLAGAQSQPSQFCL